MSVNWIICLIIDLCIVGLWIIFFLLICFWFVLNCGLISVIILLLVISIVLSIGKISLSEIKDILIVVKFVKFLEKLVGVIWWKLVFFIIVMWLLLCSFYVSWL